jgi:hypothetical protein
MALTVAEYRETLRRYKPRVFVDGQAIESVADAPSIAPASLRSDAATVTGCRVSEAPATKSDKETAEQRSFLASLSLCGKETHDSEWFRGS